jgi:translation initiation factor IF-2
MIPISAKTGEGIDDLLETIALQSEISELSANPNKLALGSVIEAQLDKQRGSIATLLVQAGTLKVGDPISVGEVHGKIRAMESATGEKIEFAGPSMPVSVLGLNGVPVAGDEFAVCESEQDARERAEKATEEARSSRLGAVAGNVASLTNISGVVEDSLQTINLILKADVSGSTEAIKAALMQLPQDRVQLRFLLSSVGEVSESDVDLAAASGGIILAFNTPASDRVEDVAKRAGVEIRSYDVIYGLIDEIRDAMEGKLSEVKDEVPVGKAEVKAVFGGGSSKVAGSLVLEGSIKKGTFMRVVRGPNRKEMYNGKVGSLRRFKDAVKKVDSGEECGIGGDPEWPDFKEGDIIECFDLVERKQTLESASETLKEQVKEYRSKDEERAAKAAAELEKYQRKRGAETPPPAAAK